MYHMTMFSCSFVPNNAHWSRLGFLVPSPLKVQLCLVMSESSIRPLPPDAHKDGHTHHSSEYQQDDHTDDGHREGHGHTIEVAEVAMIDAL